MIFQRKPIHRPKPAEKAAADVLEAADAIGAPFAAMNAEAIAAELLKHRDAAMELRASANRLEAILKEMGRLHEG